MKHRLAKVTVLFVVTFMIMGISLLSLGSLIKDITTTITTTLITTTTIITAIYPHGIIFSYLWVVASIGGVLVCLVVFLYIFRDEFT